MPIPVVSIAKRTVNTNLNGRQATPTGQPNNPSAVKYPHATSLAKNNLARGRPFSSLSTAQTSQCFRPSPTADFKERHLSPGCQAQTCEYAANLSLSSLRNTVVSSRPYHHSAHDSYSYFIVVKYIALSQAICVTTSARVGGTV
jgi:hypothetical protein